VSAGPRISVVVDNYDYGRFVGEAIASALAQTRAPAEVVVVDDGSTDGSRGVIASFGRSVVPVLKPNGGQASAINAGVEATTGDLVLFLDADDLLHREALEVVAARAVEGMAKLHFRLAAVDAAGEPLGYTLPPADRPMGSGDVVPQLLREGRYVTPTMSGNVFPRWVLDRILPVPEEDFRISADGYLVSVAPLHGPVVAVDERLGSYRVHGGNWWAPADLDAARLRAFLAHDAAKHSHLRAHAETLGLTMADDVALHDQFHLRARLGSLRLDPRAHPHPSDSRWRLLRLGARATSASDLDRRKRAAFVLWFAAVAAGPGAVARRLLRWLYVPQQRPRWATAIGGLLRRGG
jgi:glycosyltransferase involved in cell wall biosynthesis